MYYVSQCIPVMQNLYPDEDQYAKILYSFAVTIAAAITAHFARVSFDYLFTGFFMSRAKMVNDAEMRTSYGNKALDNMFKLLYHAGMVAYGYAVIRNTDCHHTWLGGDISDR